MSAQINYMSRKVEKPWNSLYGPIDGKTNNHEYDSPYVEITDIRGTTAADRERAGFNTREAGFEIIEGFGLPRLKRHGRSKSGKTPSGSSLNTTKTSMPSSRTNLV